MIIWVLVFIKLHSMDIGPVYFTSADECQIAAIKIKNFVTNKKFETKCVGITPK